VPADDDELEHRDVAAEAWWWWGWAHDRSAGLFVGLELRGSRFDYRAGLVRQARQTVYVEELDGVGRRAGLELKPPEMWADHVCDVPLRQWSLGTEAHGVLLDDLREALVRPYGTRVPVTFDVEWYATERAVDAEHGYAQAGEIDAVVELTDGLVEVQGHGGRLHVWGLTPSVADALTRAGFFAPTVDGR
jgi:hypothetical protein